MQGYENRSVAVDEVHARPYLLVEPPRAFVQLAFMNDGDLIRDRATMVELSDRIGVPVSDEDSPFHGLTWDEGDLHCEKHTEFSTYLWSAAVDPETFDPIGRDPFKNGFMQPGPVLRGTRLDVLPWTEDVAKRSDRFDAMNCCRSIVEEGMAEIITDFRQDADGMTYILVLDRGLASAQLGALVQRLLEIETYRVLALLGDPASRALIPRIVTWRSV